VARYVAGEDSKPAKPDLRVGSGPANACEPFRELILAKLEQGLSDVGLTVLELMGLPRPPAMTASSLISE